MEEDNINRNLAAQNYTVNITELPKIFQLFRFDNFPFRTCINTVINFNLHFHYHGILEQNNTTQYHIDIVRTQTCTIHKYKSNTNHKNLLPIHLGNGFYKRFLFPYHFPFLQPLQCPLRFDFKVDFDNQKIQCY